MARTDSERLEFWLTLRDSIEDSLAAGSPVVRYRIGNREVEREPTAAWLKEVDALIARLQSAVGASSGRARNLIRFQR